MTEKNKVIDTRLSYSSATLLKNCSQRYTYYKIQGLAQDEDYEDNYDAFNIGTCFHWVLEENGHTDKDLHKLLDAGCATYDVEPHKGMIEAMLLRYLQCHQTSGLEVVFCEFSLSNDKFIGFIDVILKDPETGDWWIADLKTAARFSELTTARLCHDVQLNLYASFAPEIAKQFELDPAKFKGARYRVTTKSKLKRSASESYRDHVLRTAKNVKSYDIIVPIEKMRPKETYKEHMALHAKTLKLRSGKLKPEKNTSYCDSFFKACPYWSQCYGGTFTKLKDDLDMVVSNNV